MKIVAGLGSVKDYQTLCEAGADEVFCGFVPHDWNERYGNVYPLNRREVLYYNVQIGSLSDMKILKKMEKVYGVKVTVTFNSLYYETQQYKIVAGYIKQIVDIGYKDFIIADISFIHYLYETGLTNIIKIHLSGEACQLNSLAVSYLNKYNISRYIFHRKNSIDNMAAIIAENKALCEYEAFVMNEKCNYTGAFCNSLHCDELVHMCMIPYELALYSEKNCCGETPDEKLDKELYGISENVSDENSEEILNERLVETSEESDEYIPGQSGCGLCAVYKLKSAGITHLKVVGRGADAENMVKDIKALKKLLENAESYKKAQDVRKNIFNNKCSGNCYY